MAIDGNGAITNVPEQWKVAPLAAFVSRVTYGFTNPMPSTPDGPYMLTAKDIHDGRIDYATARHTSWDAYRKLTDKSRPRVNDVLLTKDGSIGRVAICDRNDICINQSVALIQPNELINSRFLKYLLECPYYQRRMEGDSDGTTIKHIYITRVDKMEIVVPPIIEQRAIAHILGTLDDKIELNRSINETLEGMARALFNSWFVDFDPVRAKIKGRESTLPKSIANLFPDSLADSGIGEIPTGWSVGNIEQLAEINARTLSRTDPLEVIDYVEISEVKGGDIANIVRYERGSEPSRARRRLRHGDSVLSTVRPDRGAFFLALNPPETLVASTGFAVLTPKNGVWGFLYSLVTRPAVSQLLGRLADGGAYPAIRPEAVGKIPIALPPTLELIFLFEKLVKPFYEQSARNRMQSRTLAQLREALLPKLISGELRLPDVERIAGRLM
jgi:type I restriction enzyme S subunit